MNDINDQHEELIINKDKFKNLISQQIQIGETILNKSISSQQEEKEQWSSFLERDDYNNELIKQSFNIPGNSYLKNYQRQTDTGFTYYSGTTTQSYQESIGTNRIEIKSQIEKLKRLYKKIELFKSRDNKGESDKLKQLLNLLCKFHYIAKELHNRRQNRESITIEDEYDVQDLLNALLHLHFDDIRKEESSPSHAGANSRLDFVLKKEKIIIEVKMTNKHISTNKLGQDLLTDICRYKEYSECNNLVIFIYDKDDLIRNKKGFISDLESHSINNYKVTVIINPI